MSMGDVFDLPLQKAWNELAVIDKKDVVVAWADEFSGESARDLIIEVVNNHDRLTEEIQQLRTALHSSTDALERLLTLNETDSLRESASKRSYAHVMLTWNKQLLSDMQGDAGE